MKTNTPDLNALCPVSLTRFSLDLWSTQSSPLHFYNECEINAFINAFKIVILHFINSKYDNEYIKCW